MARKFKNKYELSARLEYLMRIGLVDREKLQQYKLAFKDPSNNCKFAIYREKILEVFFKIFDIMVENDPIYEKVRQQVILRYRNTRNRANKKKLRKMYGSIRKDYKKMKINEDEVEKLKARHQELLKGPRGKGWAAQTVKALAAVNRAKKLRDARADDNSRVGQSTDPSKHGEAVNRLVRNAVDRAETKDAIKRGAAIRQKALNPSKGEIDAVMKAGPTPKRLGPPERTPPRDAPNKEARVEVDKKKTLAQRVRNLFRTEG